MSDSYMDGAQPPRHDHSIKVLIIGESGVGKTSLMLRYARDSFSTGFISTVGIDYKYKFIDLDGKCVRLEIWDTAGQERFAAITRSYLRGAQGILVVYDVVDRASYRHVEKWMRNIEQYADVDVEKCLIGNKADLVERRLVTEAEGNRLADTYGVKLFECSAKEGTNVTEAFEALARQVLAKQTDKLKPEGGSNTVRPGQLGSGGGAGGGANGKAGCCK